MADILAAYDFDSTPADFKADWERLLSKKLPGDELWRFAPPRGHMELWGIALVRDGIIVSTLLEAVS